jgi:hypothetical protein
MSPSVHHGIDFEKRKKKILVHKATQYIVPEYFNAKHMYLSLSTHPKRLEAPHKKHITFSVSFHRSWLDFTTNGNVSKPSSSEKEASICASLGTYYGFVLVLGTGESLCQMSNVNYQNKGESQK